jgi:hypothetical protein
MMPVSVHMGTIFNSPYAVSLEQLSNNIFCIYKGQSNENGSPCITHMARKLVTLEFAYGKNIGWGQIGRASCRERV